MKRHFGSLACFFLFVYCFSIVAGEKYKLCIVDGKEVYKKSTRYCPKLDDPNSKVQCVVAPDRMDCLRKIQKNKADFAVFSPEDLVAADNLGLELLITNELRFKKEDQFEYQVVAVTGDHANIKSKHDLRYKRLCHPGYGYEADWTRILSNYFEANVVPLQCNSELTITENRIKSSSEYFSSACKSGPWVNNPDLDHNLKSKYRNLCRLCDSPSRCTMQDKYWGRRGTLFCLTDGAGDISWARLDDVQQHFGLTPGGAEDTPKYYSLLCPDDSVMPLNSSNPCVWVVKPWSVIASARTKAQEIQSIIANLSHTDQMPWQSSLLNLIESVYLNVETLDPVESIETYFHKAKGFLSANSFAACHPPRTIRICTTSNVENAKCSWLRESAAVYGIEPDLDCIKADNTTHCMLALQQGAADVVMVSPDLVHTAMRKYNLKTLFYETVADQDKYIALAVTTKNSDLKTFKDLKGAKACFPAYDGIAWHSTARALQNAGLIKVCSLNQEMANFFGSSCVPGIPKNESGSLWKNYQNEFSGDLGALHCLTSGMGDVAFVSRNSIQQFVTVAGSFSGPRESPDNFVIICQPNSKTCHLSWAPIGQAMVRANSTELWLRDTLDVFLQLDNLFGKNYKDLTTPFTMFGMYDSHSDVLFHDATMKIREVPTMRNTDKMNLPYDSLLKDEKICYSDSMKPIVSVILIIFSCLILNAGVL